MILRAAIVTPLFVLSLLAAALADVGPRSEGAEPTPVLVELFTSEGCSSCPPADRVLLGLLEEQPVPGVRIVALGEHVDYWDGLGWKDSFSSARCTERQRAYARRLGSGLYTPQLVVAGRGHVVGSDRGAALAAIRRAADGAPPGRLLVAAPARRGARVSLAIDASWEAGREAEVLVALVQPRTVVAVARGENAGRTLEHAAVVRRLALAGRGRGGFAGAIELEIPPPAGGWRAVVFAQEPAGGPVLAARELALDPAGPVTPGRLPDTHVGRP
jgi:hypothetical protein